MEGPPPNNEETPKGLAKHAKELLSEGKDSITTRIKRRSAQLQSKFATSTPGAHAQPPATGDWEMEGLKVPALLIQGTPMTKYSEKQGPKNRVFRLDPDQGQILWPSRKSGIISVENIKELRVGSRARQHIQHFHLPSDFESKWLTITYNIEDDYKTLHILAPTTVICRLWHVTLLQLQKVRLDFMMGLSSAERAQAIWERHHWKGADTSGDGKLDLSEVKHLCRRLNLSGGDDGVKRRFAEADAGKKGFLTYEEFKIFIRRLKERPEVEKVYLEVKGQGEFDFACFQRFMKNTQKTSRSEEEIEQMYRRFAIPSASAPIAPSTHSPEQASGQLLPPGSTAPLLAPTTSRPRAQSFSSIPAAQLPPLSLAGFAAFLTSSHNSVLADHHNDVAQDMTLPISNYFISSSHNTYLVGHQLVGESSVEGYIRSLLAGCRSVEMDIYDGDDGEPAITHGGTLTSTTTVREVAVAIAKYAFVSSPYPIIISAEVHCGLVQQKRLTEILAHTFGEALVVAPVDESHKEGDEVKCLPSPDQLKGRILLKAKNKYIDATKPKIQKLPDEPPSSDDSEKDVEEKKHSGLRGKLNQMWKRTPSKNLAPSDSKRPGTSPVPAISASPHRLSSASLAAPSQTEGQPPKILMAPELLPLLVYTTGVSFRGLGPAQTYPVTHLFSLSEPRADSLVYSGADALTLVDHAREHLVRVYPKGTRVDSSNFEPHKYWACGCQLVTVNWQTVDLGFSMVQAFYARNGRAGYILKPEALRIQNHPVLSYKPTKHTLVIRVISAQQLPRPKDTQGREIIDKDTVDPYVRIEVHLPTWPTSAMTAAPVKNNGDRGLKTKTSAIRNNGFNPRWDETLELDFDVLGGMTEFIFVRFTIKDQDVDRDNWIGMYCACLKTLELGYRHLPLYDEQYGQYLFSTLFVHLSIRDGK